MLYIESILKTNIKKYMLLFFLNNIVSQMFSKISHRGYIGSQYTMENSYKSIVSALNEDFDMIELDVQLTKDKILILHHDLFIEIPNEDSYDCKMICDLDYSELVDYKKYILTLDELFDIQGLCTKSLYLDLKGSDDLANILIEYFGNGFKFNNDIYLGTFNKEHLHILTTNKMLTKSTIKVGFITANRVLNNDLINLKNIYNIDFVSVHWNMLREDTLEYLKNINVKCFVYTCKSEFMLEHIKRFDIDGIVSDIIIH